MFIRHVDAERRSKQKNVLAAMNEANRAVWGL
jgi:hypothetical protein